MKKGTHTLVPVYSADVSIPDERRPSGERIVMSGQVALCIDSARNHYVQPGIYPWARVTISAHCAACGGTGEVFKRRTTRYGTRRVCEACAGAGTLFSLVPRLLFERDVQEKEIALRFFSCL